MNGNYGLVGEATLTKQDEIIKLMKDEIDKAYADGRTTIMGEDELEAIAERVSHGVFKARRRRGI